MARASETDCPTWDAETRAVVERARAMAAWHERRGPEGLPSRFWQDVGAQNMAMLMRYGVRSFKRSLAQNYFNWAVQGPEDPQFKALLRYWAAHPDPTPLQVEIRGDGRITSLNETHFLTTQEHMRAYALFVGMLWMRAAHGADPSVWATLREPAIGDPIPLSLPGRPISQDLGNSLREFACFKPLLNRRGGSERPVLAEIGAGYGRLAHVVMSASDARVWIFDIAPALAVAEWYLSSVWPEKVIFKWRPFTSWEATSSDIEASDVCFFSIDQLSLAPDRSVDVFAAISALHEMTEDQAASVWALMAEKSEAIFTKNWTYWRNEADAISFASEGLRAPIGWQTVFDRVDDVIPAFTEKLVRR